jgi:hypothetical protein
MGAMSKVLFLIGWLFPFLIVVAILLRWVPKDEQRERNRKRRPF